jgi:hypothetical protein
LDLTVELREAVEKYRQLAGGYETPLPLAAFGMGREETQNFFSILDEDYHISRFIHLSMNPGFGETYEINGFPQTHVAIDAEIQSTL